MKRILASLPTPRVARLLLIILAVGGGATFLTGCYGAAYRHHERVENRIDRRDHRYDRRQDRKDRRHDRWD